MERNRRIQINDSVASAELDDGVVLLNADTGIYFGLDEVGARIWRLIEGGGTEAEVARRLLDEFDAEPSQVKRDLSEFVNLLVSNDLATVAPA